jgi:phage/plasmid-associated DNA primase
MIAGAVEWQRMGLCPPAAVLNATQAYMDDEAEDIVSMWLSERCEKNPEFQEASAELYRSYKLYAEAAGEKIMTKLSLLKTLINDLNFEPGRTGQVRYIKGLKIATPIPPPPPPSGAAWVQS